MSTQKPLSSVTGITPKVTKEIGDILDLEKKYFNKFWALFTSDNFINDLKVIESEIQNNYEFLHNTWDLKNKLKIPAERIARQYVYSNLSDIITSIYPSPVSSDIAFITNDAVINIDVKTMDKIGNIGDIKNLQFENNQSSFKNKNLDVDPRYPASGVKVECLLPPTYSYNGGGSIPVLTFFLTIIYEDVKGKSFNLCKDKDLQTIHLKCLPNGSTSILFDYDIVDNFKTYSYLNASHGFVPQFLAKTKSDAEKEVKQFANRNSNCVLIHGRTKTGVFYPSVTHPRYATCGLSWFPVERKNKGFYLEAVDKGNTNRVSNDKLIVRFDYKDELWYGVKKHTI